MQTETITLKKPAKINGATRRPSEGPMLVTVADATRLRAEGAVDVATDDLADHTVADLHQIAAAEGVDLAGLSLKADIVTAIRKHRSA